MAVNQNLKCPFPYFGGKSKVAGLVWERLGDVDNYIEPFAGSAAILISRPTSPRIETLNDMDCYVANFWRATSEDPEAVAEAADWPVNEADLHARHRWLVLSDEARAFRLRMKQDPRYFDSRVAGWWCWGLCCWIGSGWCQTKESADWDQIPRGHGGFGTLPGVNSAPSDSNRPQLADAFSRGRGIHGNDNAGTCDQRRAWLLDWFARLRNRLRTVRVCCGDWKRVCDSPSVTTRLGITGIFLDPPYAKTRSDGTENRSASLYANDSTQDVDGLVADVRVYCLERGADPMVKIALCGYEGEGHESLEQSGWSVVAWKSSGGYGNRTDAGKENSARERIWFSPSCQNAERDRMPLFTALEDNPCPT
jgi:DNA adenine methylase